MGCWRVWDKSSKGLRTAQEEEGVARWPHGADEERCFILGFGVSDTRTAAEVKKEVMLEERFTTFSCAGCIYPVKAGSFKVAAMFPAAEKVPMSLTKSSSSTAERPSWRVAGQNKI